jgi:hypothetical protein
MAGDERPARGSTRSFEAIPAEAAEVLRPVLPTVAEETIAAIATDVPEYAREMEGEFGRLVRMGVEVAFNRFVDRIADSGSDPGPARGTYVQLGRGEFIAGRSLDVLLAAYRVGARLAWRKFVEVGSAADLPPEVLYQLGEAIFAYIDELSAESAEGYAEAQSAAAGEVQRRRRRLVRLLAQEPPASHEAVRTAAQDAGWALPRAVAALVAGEAEGAEARDAGPPGERPPAGEELADAAATGLARRLGGGAIGAAVGGVACVFVPDPDAPGRRRQLETLLGDETGALGPTVGWAEAAASLRRAVRMYRLAASGRVAGGGLVCADLHLPALLLSADPETATDLARSRLAPLRTLAPGQQARLTETLRAWLDRPGQVQAVAAELGVHPQTVRYRVRRLRELYGDALEDPERRFELALALRVG